MTIKKAKTRNEPKAARKRQVKRPKPLIRTFGYKGIGLKSNSARISLQRHTYDTLWVPPSPDRRGWRRLLISKRDGSRKLIPEERAPSSVEYGLERLLKSGLSTFDVVLTEDGDEVQQPVVVFYRCGDDFSGIKGRDIPPGIKINYRVWNFAYANPKNRVKEQDAPLRHKEDHDMLWP